MLPTIRETEKKKKRKGPTRKWLRCTGCLLVVECEFTSHTKATWNEWRDELNRNENASDISDDRSTFYTNVTDQNSPVTGASMSIMVFSERKRAAPSLIIRRAAASSILPSSIKCCFKTSGRGRSVRASKTSATVNLCDGGNGTSVKIKITESEK